MKRKEFIEQIKSPQWQKRRLEIMQRDEFTCQMCGSKDETLHVHHIKYVNGRKYWEYDDWELITLCEECHEYEHSNKKSVLDAIEDICKYGITFTEIFILLSDLDVALYCQNDDCILDIVGEHAGPAVGIDLNNLVDRRKKTKSTLYEKEKQREGR